jgi:hypothetical protein
MRKYNGLKVHQTKVGFTHLWVLEKSDWVRNATTAHVLTALTIGDIVYRVEHEVVTAVAGPTATLSVGVVGTVARFTDASDIATATAVPYVVAKAAGTGFIAATSGGAVTTALSNQTSGVGASIIPSPYVIQSGANVNMIANAILSDVAVTAGEVWIWACISRAQERALLSA